MDEMFSQEQEPLVIRRPRKRKKKWVLPVTITAIALLLALTAVALWYFGYEKPYQQAWNSLPEKGILNLIQQEDETVLLQWPQGANTSYYTVTVYRGKLPQVIDEQTQLPPVIFSAQVRDALECTLPKLPEDTEMTIQVSSATEYDTLLDPAVRSGEYALTVTGSFAPPIVEGLHWEPDPEANQLTIHYDLLDGQVCQLLVAKNNGQESWLLEMDQTSTVLHFGDGQKYPMPTYDDVYDFYFGSYIRQEGYVHQGISYKKFSLYREDLLGTELSMECRDEGYNRYTLTWNETKGAYYEIQRYDFSEETWVTMAQIPNTGERTYDTGHLDRYTDYRYRVVALGGDVLLPDSEFAATPAEVSFSTGASLIYSTIWPLIDLDIYSDPTLTQVVGTAEKGSAFCILGEDMGYFQIRFSQGLGYIDSNYCMINLPEFIGDICSYEIANSYESAFMVHGYQIPDVTDCVVEGFEKIRLKDESYLVPLLYPAAQKLEQAAFGALEKGYRLKIYDSYRPGEGSRYVYNKVNAILAEPLPEEPYARLCLLREDPDYVPVAPELPVLPEGQTLTYRYYMTDNGRYAINYFIANYGSRHNLGIALDLTLETADTREELVMQTPIHDLSHYSELKKNNKNAKLLSGIMKDAGFGGLVSEWWHFQDDDAQKALKLDHLWEGVSGECWMADDHGWRYRRSNGTYYTDRTVTIDGTEYTFDAEGYIAGQP